MNFRGKAHKFGDDVNTDYIISGRYKFKTLDMKELAKHVMEDLDPEFYAKLNKGDFIVAGKILAAVLSGSRHPGDNPCRYQRGYCQVLRQDFYRNAINTGLPLLECDTDLINPGDELEVDLGKGIVRNLTQNTDIQVKPLPPFMLKILSDGGLVEHFKKHGTFNLE